MIRARWCMLILKFKVNLMQQKQILEGSPVNNPTVWYSVYQLDLLLIESYRLSHPFVSKIIVCGHSLKMCLYKVSLQVASRDLSMCILCHITKSKFNYCDWKENIKIPKLILIVFYFLSFQISVKYMMPYIHRCITMLWYLPLVWIVPCLQDSCSHPLCCTGLLPHVAYEAYK
jgi:hypothetical protein